MTSETKNGWGGKRPNQYGRPAGPKELRLQFLSVRVYLRQLAALDAEVKRMNNHKSRVGKRPVTRSDIVRRLLDMTLL